MKEGGGGNEIKKERQDILKRRREREGEGENAEGEGVRHTEKTISSVLSILLSHFDKSPIQHVVTFVDRFSPILLNDPKQS